ncbi:hypothetical protein [Brevibacillus sp. 179-C9.3 HS]|uniref:hypothetical protein n=1 Tax=unclassified Brevibacillus TaxID=2684853 RepID=UPI00399F440C
MKTVYRLTRRSKWASIIALLILVMNLLPFATLVHAESLAPGAINPGDVNPGQVDSGDIRPNFQHGNYQWDTGGIVPGEIQPEAIDPGSLNSGEVQPGSVNPGEFQSGEVDPGNVNPGKVGPGSVNPGNTQPGSVTTDVTTGNPQPGQVTTGDPNPGNIGPGSPEGGKDNDTAYDYINWTFKSVFGGTLNYTAGLLETNVNSVPNLLQSKGMFLGELGTKMLDIHLKDTPLAWISAFPVDGFDAFAAAANFKFVKDMGSGVPVTGLIKGLNVATAGISLVFDGYDTFTNFRDAFDSGKSGDERFDSFVKGTGSFGSTLIDAAVISAIVPGGQTVAIVLLSVGAGLWVASKLTEWAKRLYKLFA